MPSLRIRDMCDQLLISKKPITKLKYDRNRNTSTGGGAISNGRFDINSLDNMRSIFCLYILPCSTRDVFLPPPTFKKITLVENKDSY